MQILNLHAFFSPCSQPAHQPTEEAQRRRRRLWSRSPVSSSTAAADTFSVPNFPLVENGQTDFGEAWLFFRLSASSFLCSKHVGCWTCYCRIPSVSHNRERSNPPSSSSIRFASGQVCVCTKMEGMCASRWRERVHQDGENVYHQDGRVNMCTKMKRMCITKMEE